MHGVIGSLSKGGGAWCLIGSLSKGGGAWCNNRVIV